MQAPAVIVVGGVAALEMAPTIRRPLEGARVGLLGTPVFVEKLERKFQALGAKTVRMAAAAVERCLRERGVPAYDERTRRGLLRHIYVRTNREGEALVCLVVNGRSLPCEEELAAAVRRAVPKTVGVVLSVNTQDTNVALGEEYRTIWGTDELEDTLCGLRLRLSVPSFYQVNRDQAERLYGKALEFAGLTGRETVLDLYCGAGRSEERRVGKECYS